MKINFRIVNGMDLQTFEVDTDNDDGVTESNLGNKVYYDVVEE